MSHFSPTHRSPNRSHHRSPRSPHGSLLIWSVFLGFILTSVFFFFGMRQRAMVSEQRDTTAILNAKSYMESYADYLQKKENRKEISSVKFDGMTVMLTQKTDVIEGWVDQGASVAYNFGMPKTVAVEWNKCSDNGKTNLIIEADSETSYLHQGGPSCSLTSPGYDDTTNATVPAGLTLNSFEIKTSDSPTFYKITGNDLKDKIWRLEITKDIGYGKIITVKRTFPDA